MRLGFTAAVVPLSFRRPRTHRCAQRRAETRMGSGEGQLVLVCDVLDTLVADPFSRMHSHFGFSDMKSFLAAKAPGTWEAFELGQISETELSMSFFRDGRKADIDALKQFLSSSYTLLPGIAELLGDFKAAQVPVYLCSNYGPWDALIEAAVGLSSTYSATWTFVSASHGVRKPDKAAYEKTALLANVDVAQCVLLDDRERNCAGARDAGYAAAVKFSNTKQTREELAAIFGDWVLSAREEQ